MRKRSLNQSNENLQHYQHIHQMGRGGSASTNTPPKSSSREHLHLTNAPSHLPPLHNHNTLPPLHPKPAFKPQHGSALTGANPLQFQAVASLPVQYLTRSLSWSSLSGSSGSGNCNTENSPKQTLASPSSASSLKSLLPSNELGSMVIKSSLGTGSFTNGASSNNSSMHEHYKRNTRRKRIDSFRTKMKPYLRRTLQLLIKLYNQLLKVKVTWKQKLLSLLLLTAASSIYIHVNMPTWENEREWTEWEHAMQQSVRDLVPPLPLGVDEEVVDSSSAKHRTATFERFSHLDHLRQFPDLRDRLSHQFDKASEYAVPVPDYELMGRVRGELARNLHEHAQQTCQRSKEKGRSERRRLEQNEFIRQPKLHDNTAKSTKHTLPVMGITVANDTPENRYLRRLLYTIDLTAVGSIVITWYDENTEAQLVDKQKVGLSHAIVDQALGEYIDAMGFVEVDWEEGAQHHDKIQSNMGEGNLQLASPESLSLMSQISSSIHQYCIFYGKHDAANMKNAKSTTPSLSSCLNELLILRFSTNLGCSSGVNNPLFTHPTAPHWLISNYDIAYPSGVLSNMGKEVHRIKQSKPDLAVHSFGYIYGRGNLENPWSNFVMTSCAVANVGVWDEDIFPAYYEDDDFRDRIRYIMGKWIDVVGGAEVLEGYEDAPQKLMNDAALIEYQTDRNVSVAHGPLSATSYISGTHATMKKVADEEKEENQRGFFHFLRSTPSQSEILSLTAQNPFHYESQRWKTVRELSDAQGFFRCKHGALPDAGEFGQDTLRYFGWNERFLMPFVNETRVTRFSNSRIGVEVGNPTENGGAAERSSAWSSWSFNATRRQCVHEGANLILAMPPSEERMNLTMQLRQSCSVCSVDAKPIYNW